MTWNGDITKMGDLADRMRDLGSVPSRASKQIARELRSLISDEFDFEADPYGNAWEQLQQSTLDKRQKAAPPGLDDSGDMRASLRVAPSRGAGVSITIDHPAACHQTGWDGSQGSGPARPILPMAEMPDLWEEAISNAVASSIKQTVGK